jgi:hypothetical protein
MPVDYSRYPDDWHEISRHIRFERAGNRCEWCGVRNGAVGARDKNGKWWDEDAIHSLNAGVGDTLFGDFPNMIRIVLTVAHLGAPKPDGTPGDKHDKMDCRDENLAALCQRCHLNYDRDEHLVNARRTRAEKRRRVIAQSGQIALWDGEL